MDKYYWSFDREDEVWTNSGETIEECLEQAREESRGKYKTVYIAESVPFEIKEHMNVDAILEDLEQRAYDFAGEAAESWQPSRDMKYPETIELERALGSLLENWLNEHGYAPRFGRLENTAEYDLYEEGGQCR